MQGAGVAGRYSGGGAIASSYVTRTPRASGLNYKVLTFVVCAVIAWGAAELVISQFFRYELIFSSN